MRMRRTVRVETRVAHRSPGSRGKVKSVLYYSVFKEQMEAKEKAPSLSMPKSRGGYNRIF